MTRMQFEMKFMEVSKYASNLVAMERDNAKEFQDWLNKAIRDEIVPFLIEDYAEAVRRALVIVETVHEVPAVEATTGP